MDTRREEGGKYLGPLEEEVDGIDSLGADLHLVAGEGSCRGRPPMVFIGRERGEPVGEKLRKRITPSPRGEDLALDSAASVVPVGVPVVPGARVFPSCRCQSGAVGADMFPLGR